VCKKFQRFPRIVQYEVFEILIVIHHILLFLIRIMAALVGIKQVSNCKFFVVFAGSYHKAADD
jgi:hypothetical protein